MYYSMNSSREHHSGSYFFSLLVHWAVMLTLLTLWKWFLTLTTNSRFTEIEALPFASLPGPHAWRLNVLKTINTELLSDMESSIPKIQERFLARLPTFFVQKRKKYWTAQDKTPLRCVFLTGGLSRKMLRSANMLMYLLLLLMLILLFTLQHAALFMVRWKRAIIMENNAIYPPMEQQLMTRNSILILMGMEHGIWDKSTLK